MSADANRIVHKLSAWVPRANHWSAASAGALRNPEGAASILTLDAVVCNEARHAVNLLLVADEAGGSTTIAIDADEALIGHAAERSPRARAARPAYPRARLSPPRAAAPCVRGRPRA